MRHWQTLVRRRPSDALRIDPAAFRDWTWISRPVLGTRRMASLEANPLCGSYCLWRGHPVGPDPAFRDLGNHVERWSNRRYECAGPSILYESNVYSDPALGIYRRYSDCKSLEANMNNQTVIDLVSQAAGSDAVRTDDEALALAGSDVHLTGNRPLAVVRPQMQKLSQSGADRR